MKNTARSLNLLPLNSTNSIKNLGKKKNLTNQIEYDFITFGSPYVSREKNNNKDL